MKHGRKVNKQHLPRLSTLGSNFLEERAMKNKRHKEKGGAMKRT